MGEREELVAQLRERALYYATLSTLGLPPHPAPAGRGSRGASAGDLPPGPARRAEPPLRSLDAAPDGAGPADLEGVRTWLGDCRRCKLSTGRKSIVFGQGSPNAELMFVGEAPGADEDEQGLAFVGRAGQLLTRIIEAMGLRREDVFIANCIKCRPPQNRNPEPDEVLACQPFLESQIAVIRPKVIVGLGKFGAQWLLKTAEPISRLRGHLGDYRGIPVMPTYHPAYLLRNPGAKKEVWEDMKVVRELLKA